MCVSLYQTFPVLFFQFIVLQLFQKPTSCLVLLINVKFFFDCSPNLSSPVTSTTILTVHLINPCRNFFLFLTCLISQHVNFPTHNSGLLISSSHVAHPH